MSISFNCVQCGKAFKVGNELAGKKGKCTQCGTIFRIPAKKGAAPAAVAAKKPAPAAAGDPFAGIGVGDGSVFYEPPEYAVTASPTERSSVGSWLVFLLVLLVLAGGAGAAFLHKDYFLAPPGVDVDLRYLPNDCKMIVALNVENVRGSETYAKVLEALKPLNLDVEKQFEGVSGGLALEDIRRVTAGLSNAEGYPSVVIVRTTRPVEVDEIRKTVTALSGKVLPFTEDAVGKYTLHTADDLAFCRAGEKTVLLGKPDVLQAVLERNGKATLSVAMQEGFARVDFERSSLAWLAEAKALQQGIQEGGKQAVGMSPVPLPAEEISKIEEKVRLEDLEALLLQIDLSDKIELKATAVCKNAEAAEHIRKQADDGIEAARTLSRSSKDAPKDLVKMIESVETGGKGSVVTFHFTTDVNAVISLARGGAGMMMNPAAPMEPKQE